MVWAPTVLGQGGLELEVLTVYSSWAMGEDTPGKRCPWGPVSMHRQPVRWPLWANRPDSGIPLTWKSEQVEA